MDTTNEITPDDSVVPVFLEPMSEQELLNIVAEQERIIAEQQAMVDAKNSAIAKLEAIGLTTEEITALIGGN